MLASSAPDVIAALAKAGGDQVALDVKLDGIRIQVHRHGDEVRVATRSLDDITDRLPEVDRRWPARCPRRPSCWTARRSRSTTSGRPRAFQETASRTARARGPRPVTPYFFDLLHLSGRDLLDSPATERLAALDRRPARGHRVPRLVTGRRRRWPRRS